VARQNTVLTIFVASPYDVTEEREIVSDVITNINRTWPRKFGLSLEYCDGKLIHILPSGPIHRL
jgi:hypothetical protein